MLLTELLKQKQYVPRPAEEQVIVVYAGVKGYFDRMVTNEIDKFKRMFLSLLRASIDTFWIRLAKKVRLTPRLSLN